MNRQKATYGYTLEALLLLLHSLHVSVTASDVSRKESSSIRSSSVGQRSDLFQEFELPECQDPLSLQSEDSEVLVSCPESSSSSSSLLLSTDLHGFFLLPKLQKMKLNI